MRATIVFLLVMSLAVATPAVAEWTFIVRSNGGDQYFYDPSTLQKGARPRAWFLINFSSPTRYGDMSAMTFTEADCSEGKKRQLAARFYADPMAASNPTTTDDKTQQWVYAAPGTIDELTQRILCK